MKIPDGFDFEYATPVDIHFVRYAGVHGIFVPTFDMQKTLIQMTKAWAVVGLSYFFRGIIHFEVSSIAGSVGVSPGY